jgi:uncharacterized membrane protein (DUF2068 family)
MVRTHQVSDVQRRVLRSVALLELAKGLLVLLVGAGLLSLSRRGLDFESVARHLLGVVHLHRGRLYEVFLRAAGGLGDTNLVKVAVVAGTYSAMRFVESYGLWKQRVWAEWVALISGASYLPLEIYGLSRHANAMKWAVFLLNLVVVLYMVYLRAQDRAARGKGSRSARGPAELG